MKLYYIPASCSLAAHIVIRELGLNVELVKVDHRTHLTAQGQDFYAINELGYAPVLELADGRRLREGVVILQYLADQVPEAGLAPSPHSFERYRLQEWLAFLASEIHKGFIPLLYAAQAGEYLQTVRPKLLQRFAWLDRQLAERPFVAGERFSVADAYLFALVGWGSAHWLTSYYHADIALDEFVHLRCWYEAVRARPAVIGALQAEGLGCSRMHS